MLLLGINLSLSAGKFEDNIKACDGGNMESCSNLGFMYEKGRGMNRNYTEAVKLYRKACDGGKC